MKALSLFAIISLLCSPVNAEVFWQVYIIKNNDRVNVETVTEVAVATATVRLNLPGMPVKAVIEPEIRGTISNGTPFAARMLAVEFLDGSGAAIGTMCADLPQQGGVNTMLVRRYGMMYQIDLGCVTTPEAAK